MEARQIQLDVAKMSQGHSDKRFMQEEHKLSESGRDTPMRLSKTPETLGFLVPISYNSLLTTCSSLALTMS